jgi:DNA polymerase III epsilon subunit-like protein
MILTFIDTETTGLKTEQHEIIEFGALRVELDKQTLRMNPLESFSFRIKPLHIGTASDQALKVNGYNDAGWANAIHPRESVSLIKGLIRETDILVGQNLIFDLRFIKKLCKKYKSDIRFPYYIDTKQMAEDCEEEDTSLDILCKKYNVQFNGKAHTASVDCDRTYKIFKELLHRSIPRYHTFTEPFVSEKRYGKKIF